MAMNVNTGRGRGVVGYKKEFGWTQSRRSPVGYRKENGWTQNPEPPARKMRTPPDVARASDLTSEPLRGQVEVAPDHFVLPYGGRWRVYRGAEFIAVFRTQADAEAAALELSVTGSIAR